MYTIISHRVIRPHQCAPYRITTCLPRDTENAGKYVVRQVVVQLITELKE